jgi:hypothetical protein
MTIRGLFLITALMMSNSVYSQTGSVRQIVYEGEKGLFVPPAKARYINNAHLSWLQCREECDSLSAMMDLCTQSFLLHDSIVQAKDQQLAIQGISITDRNNLILAQKTSIQEKDKTIRKLKTAKTFLGISTGVLAVIALIALL